MEYKNILIAIDARTNIIVWSTSYADWPRMVPLDPELTVISFNERSTITEKEIINFRAAFVDARLIDAGPPSFDGIERLELLRMKCRLCWRWLKSLYDWQRSNTSYLPDVPVGKKGTTERQLYEDQKEAIAEIVAIEISDYHHLIWKAKTIEEIEVLADNLHDKRDFVVK